MRRRMALEWLIGALALGCGGATFTTGDPDGGPDASSTTGGSSTSSGSTTGTSTGSSTTGSSTTGSGGASTTGGPGTSGTGGAGGAGSGGRGGSTGTGGGTGGDAGIDWSQCGGPGECSAELTGCCGPCGMPMINHFAGVNPKYKDAFRAETCPVPVPCPRCATSFNPYIAARCVNGHCQPFDTRLVPEFSKCTTYTDCRLRKGLECCECGSQGEWTAVSVAGQAALNAAVCPPMIGCADCLPVPPTELAAVCIQGHCEALPPPP